MDPWPSYLLGVDKSQSILSPDCRPGLPAMPGDGCVRGALEQDATEAGGDKGVQFVLEIAPHTADRLSCLAGAALNTLGLSVACLGFDVAKGNLHKRAGRVQTQFFALLCASVELSVWVQCSQKSGCGWTFLTFRLFWNSHSSSLNILQRLSLCPAAV